MSFDDFGEGACINCGFLGKRPTNEHIAECFGVTAKERADGNIGVTERGVIPWCFMGKYHLAKEVNEVAGNEPANNKVSTVIQRGRACDGWYDWTEWLSPKEHYEELKMRWLEDQHKQSQKLVHRLTIIAIILAAIGIILAMLQIGTAFLIAYLFHD